MDKLVYSQIELGELLGRGSWYLCNKARKHPIWKPSKAVKNKACYSRERVGLLVEIIEGTLTEDEAWAVWQERKNRIRNALELGKFGFETFTPVKRRQAAPVASGVRADKNSVVAQ